RVDDGHGHVVDSVAAGLTLSNAAPSALIMSPAAAVYGNAFVIALFSATDPSDADTAAGFHYAFGLDPADFAAVSYGSGSSAAGFHFFSLPAGDYTVYARIIDKDNGYRQYQAAVTVSKALLTVHADDQSRTYGHANPALSASYSGFRNGETLETSGV